MAQIVEVFGDAARANDLRRKAAELQKRFEERFWSEELGFYAFGLDPDKRRIDTVASNAGHLLWSGIVRPDRAARVVSRLLQGDMWSGWGIRTLSEPSSVWRPTLRTGGSASTRSCQPGCPT